MFRTYVAGNLLSYHGEVYVVVKASLRVLNLRSFFNSNKTITLVSTKGNSDGCIIRSTRRVAAM